MNKGSLSNPGAAAGRQPQLITDDFVEALTEIGSFFMPPGIIVTPLAYVNDLSQVMTLQTNILLAEIYSQQILECEDRLSISLRGLIVEGFKKPRDFIFFISHSYLRAKVFPDRNTLQTFALSEFLRLEYPEISLVITNTLFNLHFTDHSKANRPNSFFNGDGYLLFGEEHL